MNKSNALAFCMHNTVKILDQARVAHARQNREPLLYVAFSGGKDSAVMLDVAARYARSENIRLRAMSIDTGLSCDGWVDMVARHCDALNVPLEVANGKYGFKWYRSDVMKYGFGTTPTTHTVYYRKLKQDAIQYHLQTVKRDYHDRVLYLTGVRRDESVKRHTTKDIIRHGARVTVNAIAHWPKSVRDAYLSSLTWWDNPYYDVVGNSGDCQCGWTCRNRLADLEPYPRLHAKIAVCQAASLRSGMNRYGERYDAQLHGYSDDMPEDSLCVNCARPKDT